MTDIRPLCSTCDHFAELGTDDDGVRVGECRRRAPVATLINGRELRATNVEDAIPWAIWPRVWGTSWCGEHSKLGTT
jgi:hypothetical protein